MASNRGVVYLGPGKVEVQSIDFPKMQAPTARTSIMVSSSRSSPPTSAARTSTWCAAARPRRPVSCWDTRSRAR